MTKKARFIEKLHALSEGEKKEAAAFFTTHPNYEKHIDWNSASLTYPDFQKVFSLAENSSRGKKRKAKADPRLLFEKHNCEIISQTGDFLIAVPLDWDCAVFFNSFACGGEGAKWCIGSKDNPQRWNDYVSKKSIFFLVFFTKRHPVFQRKIAIQYDAENDGCTVWLQNGKGFGGLSSLFDLLRETPKGGNIFYGNETPPGMIQGMSSIVSVSRILGAEMEKIRNGGGELLRKTRRQEYAVKDSVLIKYFPDGYYDEIAVIPPALGITEIGERAFWGCAGLTGILLPETLTAIGNRAFWGCKSLAAITLPDSLTAIGEHAFSGCKSLATIAIPDGVSAIGNGAFYGCESLAAITLPGSLTAIGDWAFKDCKNLKTVRLSRKTAVAEDAFAGAAAEFFYTD